MDKKNYNSLYREFLVSFHSRDMHGCSWQEINESSPSRGPMNEYEGEGDLPLENSRQR